MSSVQRRALQAVLILLMLAGVYFLGNLVPRSDFQTTFWMFSALFALMISVFALAEEKPAWMFILFSGLLIRCSLLLAVPQWSEDYARFLWDGELLRLGENPYTETPAEFVQNNSHEASPVLGQLFPLLNSPDYHSVYTPLNQGFFWLSAQASGGFVAHGIISLRLLLILGEVGVFILFVKLLNAFNLPSKLLWLYWLNPLVILEITGNLHFEGMVLLLLFLLIWAVKRRSYALAGGFWGLAIGLKLLPLILFPALALYPNTGRNRRFWFAAALTLVLVFGWLLLASSWEPFMVSLALYQGKFEFNASVYYLLREVGFWIEGYNTIAVLSKLLSLATLGLLVFFSWKKKPSTLPMLIDLWVLIYLVYLLLQPVVHPWYVIPAFGLSLLTEKKSFLLWSFAAIFSYEAYSAAQVEESPLILSFEYLLVASGIFLDYILPKYNTKTSHEVSS